MSSWRPFAENGRHDEAHTAFKNAGTNAVRDETADLLRARDAAQPVPGRSCAVPRTRCARTFKGPAPAPCPFTLGRVLVDELDRPAEAADAFARARSAGGPLARALAMTGSSYPNAIAKQTDGARDPCRLRDTLSDRTRPRRIDEQHAIAPGPRLHRSRCDPHLTRARARRVSEAKGESG
jgi:hypothetical protein